MKLVFLNFFAAGLLITATTTTKSQANDVLVKLASPVSAMKTAALMQRSGLRTEVLTESWVRVRGNIHTSTFNNFIFSSAVQFSQPNYKVKILENPNFHQLKRRFKNRLIQSNADLFSLAGIDNPELPDAPAVGSGSDPLFARQWGMKNIGTEAAWNFNRGNNKIIVAVIDTGVDYTHEDLLPNLWRNKNEIPANGIDDDKNGYVDDIIGWDFLSKDNKPYDLAATSIGELLNGGNPGHGTHCAGNVAAAGANGKGISGVAPKAQIMVLRFIGNEGGTTADAIKAIHYAVDNGAKILSNSWGSEGEDPSEGAENLALKESVSFAESKNVLFIAAAGNGHQGVGYNNDTDAKPAYPASYENENIISVAALDSTNNLGSFSNWGMKSVDIGAPGVKVFSTTVGGKYSDTVIDLLNATWDGTSMACPHVAGAAALYWSVNPEKNWKDVKAAILNSVKRIPSLEGKVLSNGKLDVENLMRP